MSGPTGAPRGGTATWRAPERSDPAWGLRARGAAGSGLRESAGASASARLRLGWLFLGFRLEFGLAFGSASGLICIDFGFWLSVTRISAGFDLIRVGF